MGSSNLFLTPNSAALSLAAGNNAFVTAWGNKRSATCFGISVVFYDDGTHHADGYATLETSNAPAQLGSGFQGPNNGGDDAATVPGSQQTITLNPTTGLYTATWEVSNMGAAWVRVRYTANTNKTGLSVNVYFSAPHESGL